MSHSLPRDLLHNLSSYGYRCHKMCSFESLLTIVQLIIYLKCLYVWNSSCAQKYETLINGKQFVSFSFNSDPI